MSWCKLVVRIVHDWMLFPVFGDKRWISVLFELISCISIKTYIASSKFNILELSPLKNKYIFMYIFPPWACMCFVSYLLKTHFKEIYMSNLSWMSFMFISLYYKLTEIKLLISQMTIILRHLMIINMKFSQEEGRVCYCCYFHDIYLTMF